MVGCRRLRWDGWVVLQCSQIGQCVISREFLAGRSPEVETVHRRLNVEGTLRSQYPSCPKGFLGGWRGTAFSELPGQCKLTSFVHLQMEHFTSTLPSLCGSTQKGTYLSLINPMLLHPKPQQYQGSKQPCILGFLEDWVGHLKAKEDASRVSATVSSTSPIESDCGALQMPCGVISADNRSRSS